MNGAPTVDASKRGIREADGGMRKGVGIIDAGCLMEVLSILILVSTIR